MLFAAHFTPDLYSSLLNVPVKFDDLQVLAAVYPLLLGPGGAGVFDIVALIHPVQGRPLAAC